MKLKHAILAFVGIVLLASLVLGLLTQVEPQQAAGPPNVLLIVIDTLRADRVDAERAGEPVMPFVRNLGEQGLRFDHAIAPSSWTRSSMASVFTTEAVDTHEVYWGINGDNPEDLVSDHLCEAWTTLAEHLETHGYKTFGVQTNPNLAAEIGFAQGFAGPAYVYGPGIRADAVTDIALNGLNGLQPPFLLYAHYMDPHVPYDPPAPYRQMFGPLPALNETDQMLFARFMDFYMDCAREFLGLIEKPTLPRLSPEGKEHVWALYDGESRFADDEVRRLVKSVREQHPNTVVIVTSDHGEEFWERGGMGHGTALFEEQVHVPWIVAGPGIPPRRVEHPVSLGDLLPTMASLLQLPASPAWTGQAQTAETQARPVFSRTRGGWKGLGVEVESVHDGTLKLLRNPETDVVHLFDLAADPREQNDLAQARPEDTARLRALLVERHANNVRRRLPECMPAHAVSPEKLEELEALGYFEK